MSIYKKFTPWSLENFQKSQVTLTVFAIMGYFDQNHGQALYYLCRHGALISEPEDIELAAGYLKAGAKDDAKACEVIYRNPLVWAFMSRTSNWIIQWSLNEPGNFWANARRHVRQTARKIGCKKIRADFEVWFREDD